MPDFHDFLAVLYAFNNQSLRRLVSGKLRSKTDAEDVVQDAFVRILAMDRNIPITSPVGLLTRVTLNLATDRRRADNLRARHMEPDSEWASIATLDASPEENAEARQLSRLLQATIEKLPRRCREVFVLHRFKGLSHNEIALRMGISNNMVEKHIIRALIDLRQCHATFSRASDE